MWEGLWHAAGRSGQGADFVKGLIQLAVAGVKRLQGIEEGVRTHAARAAELWHGVADERLLGLTVAALIEMAGTIAAGGWPEPAPVLPLDVLSEPRTE